MENFFKKREVVAVVLALVVIGALIARPYPQAGLYTVAGALVLYIVANAKRAFEGMKTWREAGWELRMGAILVPLVAGLTVAMLVTGEAWYFAVLMMLCLDFLIKDEA